MNDQVFPAAIPVPIDAPPGHWRRWTTHCPQPLTPFFRGPCVTAVTEGFRRTFREMGVFPETLEVREIGGWVYTRLVPLGDEEGTSPPPELVRKRIRDSVDAICSDRFGAYLEQWPQWRSEFVNEIVELRRVDLSAFDDSELLRHFNELMEFAQQAFDVHFLLHGINAVMLADLAFACRELFGWDDNQTLELLSGLSEASTKPATGLSQLTSMARQRPAVSRFIEKEEQADPSMLPKIDPEFGKAFFKYQAEFGFRTVRYEVCDPSFQERPSLVLRLIRDQLRSGFDPQARADELVRRREKLRAEARAQLNGRPESDRARFERALERAERWYPVREDNGPMTVSEPLALIRRVALEIGQRLRESSMIDDPEDVFFLEIKEACAALVTRRIPAANSRTLVRRRKAERAWVEAHPGPPSYGPDAEPQPTFDDLPAETRFVNAALIWLIERSGHHVPPQGSQAGLRLTGLSASVGRYTGPVRVVCSEADFDKLRPGDVLVCPITAPAWSVLFSNAGALVTDAGSILCHPAIIAREFHIPAVVATGNATALLRDDQTVMVDGTAGWIEVLP